MRGTSGLSSFGFLDCSRFLPLWLSLVTMGLHEDQALALAHELVFLHETLARPRFDVVRRDPGVQSVGGVRLTVDEVASAQFKQIQEFSRLANLHHVRTDSTNGILRRAESYLWIDTNFGFVLLVS